jgi:hypothetical protein
MKITDVTLGVQRGELFFSVDLNRKSFLLRDGTEQPLMRVALPEGIPADYAGWRNHRSTSGDGFCSGSSMFRGFGGHLGITPHTYRERFRTTAIM